MSDKLHQARRGLMAIRLEVDQSIADDLTRLVEDAIAELKAALKRALADGAAMREAMDFIKDLEVEVMFRGHGEDYAKMAFPMRHWRNLCKVHAADHPSDKLPAVVKAARELDIVGIEAMRMALRRIGRSEALPDALMRDILDRSEAKDG